MAAITLQLPVATQQRKSSQVVVEENVVLPAGFAVTLDARLTLSSVVRIVRSVAAVAASR